MAASDRTAYYTALRAASNAHDKAAAKIRKAFVDGMKPHHAALRDVRAAAKAKTRQAISVLVAHKRELRSLRDAAIDEAQGAFERALEEIEGKHGGE